MGRNNKPSATFVTLVKTFCPVYGEKFTVAASFDVD